MATYSISHPLRFEVQGRAYFFIPRSGSLLEADTSAIALADWIADSSTVSEERVQQFLSHHTPPQDAREAVEGFFTFGILKGQDLIQIRRPEIRPGSVPVRHLIASVSQACNLRCGYCYADFGHYRREPDMMELKTAHGYVDFLLANSAGATQVVYTFFGGEPLLNFPVVRETVLYGRAREQEYGTRIQFGLTTNGTVLTPEMIDFLARQEVETTVSIDGTREMNDRLRPFAGGSGSYEVLRERVAPLLARRPTPARVTVTNQNLDLPAIFEGLTEMGFAEVGFSPVSSGDPRYALNLVDRDRFVDGLETLTDRTLAEIPRGRILGFSNLLQLIRQIHEAEVHHHPCGAGMGLLAGNSEGELYACHRLINDTEFTMGSLTGGVDRDAQAKHLERLHVDRKTPCQSCWAQGLCGGGCYAVAKTETGSAEQVPWEHCDSIRRWYRAGIHAYVRLTSEHPEVVQRVAGASKTLESYQEAPV